MPLYAKSPPRVSDLNRVYAKIMALEMEAGFPFRRNFQTADNFVGLKNSRRRDFPAHLDTSCGKLGRSQHALPYQSFQQSCPNAQVANGILGSRPKSMMIPRVIAPHRNHEKNSRQYRQDLRTESAGGESLNGPYQVWQLNSKM